MIGCSKAYILFEVKANIPFVNNDNANDNANVKTSFTLRNSDDVINNLRIKLNNLVISDEVDIDKANLVNFILHDSNKKN